MVAPRGGAHDALTRASHALPAAPAAAALVQEEQFAGWMGCIHALMLKPVPVVSAGSAWWPPAQGRGEWRPGGAYYVSGPLPARGFSMLVLGLRECKERRAHAA